MPEQKDIERSSGGVGVYVCHCGTNIAGTVDVNALTDYAATLPGVTVARNYKYACSTPGQELIKRDIRELNLTRVVVAACSPCLHEKTFRNAVAEGGLNPYYFHMVNLREHDSWVHTDKAAATAKAIDLVRAGVRAIKIEGRQRSPAYVAQVTRVWRRALDACLRDCDGYRVDGGWMEALAGLSEGQSSTLGAYDRPWK